MDADSANMAGVGIDRAEYLRWIDACNLRNLVDSVESNMNKLKFISMWSIAMGSMDTLTGILLVFFPLHVLRLLGISPPSPDATVYLSWIGVFVCGVGLSYGLALGRRSRGETVWVFTSLIRSLVAVFLLVQIIMGSLAPAWALVGIADGFVAVVQIFVLRSGWWKGVAK